MDWRSELYSCTTQLQNKNRIENKTQVDSVFLSVFRILLVFLHGLHFSTCISYGVFPWFLVLFSCCMHTYSVVYCWHNVDFCFGSCLWSNISRSVLILASFFIIQCSIRKEEN